MRVAAAQFHPAWLDPEGGTKLVVSCLEQAAAASVDLLAFGETFLSGYPVWVSETGGARFDDAKQKRAYAAYLAAAVELDGPELATIREAAADLGVFVHLGVTERGGGPGRGSVYATLVALDPVSGVVGAHRKLRPTFEERLVWAPGDGHGLRVHALPSGWRVGGLNCWENWMPLARAAMYAGGEDLHVSVWPGSVALTRDITRFVAREGRVWSLAAGALLSMDDIPRDFPLYDELAEAGGVDRDGGSAVAAPDGSWLVEPVAGEAGLVIADLDRSRVDEERHNFDPTGHYARPDVLHLDVDRRRREGVTFSDAAPDRVPLR
ncbi:carbon-nitrogen hydrolase family protein [Egicoccus halophilus]|uniref:Nitrilase n=1 Tax=Egicoccus halophilus TaxID=1670830 RepID=A0A8J3AHF3_9ACTN|nr:carbon-nitrogen hydrolase family protein [Egicoccus halophilus]GGI09417.1 nitrilase [Egicoccus halophilus]